MYWRGRTQRRPAFNDFGHAHELTFCCVSRHPFLGAERVCGWLADAVNAARVRYGFAVWAYVFMPDHAHLIVHPETAGYDIRHILKAVKEPVGRIAITHLRTNHPEWLPRLTIRKGGRSETRFWQPGGGYDRNVTEPKTLHAMVEYIHNNPVRKAWVPTAGEWKWSSAGWFEGREPNTLKPDPIPPDWGNVV